MNLKNFPWKPVAKDVAVVVAREAGVYLFRMAIDHAIDRIHSPGTGPKAGERPHVVRPHRGRKPRTEADIQNGVDPEGPGRRSSAAQRRVRDENGRFSRKTPNRKGGDSHDAALVGDSAGGRA